MTPDFVFNLPPGDIIYDVETYPNCFTLTALHTVTEQVYCFEISFRRSDLWLLCEFIRMCKNTNWVGFNSLHFDYPIVHLIHQCEHAPINHEHIYKKAMSIIDAPKDDKFSHMIWESEWIVPQIDLYKIHHFDNNATSLKVLEFNMRMDNVEGLPFPVGTELSSDQIDKLIEYNLNDVKATHEFYKRSQPQIELRRKLSKEFNMSMINWSDVKMGEKILVYQMENNGVKCFEYGGAYENKKRQTIRRSINLRDVMLPYVKFEHPEFRRIKTYLESQTITETKGIFKELIATVDGVEYKIGTGGLHASVESQTVYSDKGYQIVDVDVASFYPNLGIVNNLYPAHLGVEFCEAYQSVYETRKTYQKGSPENEAFKLALNGAYGGSNNKYSPMFDRLYTMNITINGQLLLCMLVEQMIKVPGLKMIQGNTDGITYLCPNEHIDHTRDICRWWEKLTNLTLEEVLYKRMFIRDVNSYIAEKYDGKLKRIGAYAYETTEENPGTRELPHHKDWSHRVVAKAAEAALVHGEDIRKFIGDHDDIYDFFLRTKIPKKSALMWGDEQVDNVTRYYVSTEGKPLNKFMPAAGPLGTFKRANSLTDHYYNEILAEVGTEWDERIHTKNKSIYEERSIGVQTGYTVQVCNNLKGHTFSDINYEWYVKEAEKLVKGLS